MFWRVLCFMELVPILILFVKWSDLKALIQFEHRMIGKRIPQHEKVTEAMQECYVVLQLMVSTGESRDTCVKYAENILERNIAFNSYCWLPEFVDEKTGKRRVSIEIPGITRDPFLKCVYFEPIYKTYDLIL